MKQFLLSFVYAFNGLTFCCKKERNFIIHLIAALLVLITAWIFDLSSFEWMIIVLNIGLVIGFEMFNTCIERICNVVHPQHSSLIKIIKDVAAGAVLLAAVVALTCGLIIFIPKIF